VLTAVIAGAATPGGPVVGFSIGAVALRAGGGSPQVLAYVVAWRCSPFSGCCSGKSRSCRRVSFGFEPRFPFRSVSGRRHRHGDRQALRPLTGEGFGNGQFEK